MKKDKATFFTIVFLISVLLLILLDYTDRQFSIHDIIVEFHGLVFDLVIFGIVLTIYESVKDKQEKIAEQERKSKEKKKEKKRIRNTQIERYSEELEDYKFWKSEEAKFRNRGIVKRLLKLGVTEIDLSFSYLEDDNSLIAKNLSNWKFTGAFMKNSGFSGNNLNNTNFYLTDLTNAIIINSSLVNSDFSSSILIDTKFSNCSFKNTKLENAIVTSKNWFNELKKNKNTNIEELFQKYEIIEDDNMNNIYRITLKE